HTGGAMPEVRNRNPRHLGVTAGSAGSLKLRARQRAELLCATPTRLPLQFGGAVVAEPDLDLRCVCPEERGHAGGKLRGRPDGQALEQLHVGRALIKLARRAAVAMHTFTLTKHLFGHHSESSFVNQY